MEEYLIKEIKKGNVKLFYKNSRWLEKRADILERDNFECQECKKEGGFHIAECVHHIKPLRKAPKLALTNSNLISLCNVCHNIKHPEKLNNRSKKPMIFIEERWE